MERGRTAGLNAPRVGMVSALSNRVQRLLHTNTFLPSPCPVLSLLLQLLPPQPLPLLRLPLLQSLPGLPEPPFTIIASPHPHPTPPCFPGPLLRNEGVAALWSGLGPSLARGFFFGGARLGLYTPIKTVIAGDVPVQSLSQKVRAPSQGARRKGRGGMWRNTHGRECLCICQQRRAVLLSTPRSPGLHTFALTAQILAGSLSGGLAAAATSPIELVKTRMQAAGVARRDALGLTGYSRRAGARSVALRST
eukprot:363247-Chlamydomonas_euryale.AAC.3